MRVLLFGASGSIGQAVAQELRRRGLDVLAVRRANAPPLPSVAQRLLGDFSPEALRAQVWQGERFEAVVSCLASRSGLPADAWAIDHAAHQALLQVALQQGATRWLQLSALCLQKPRLAFQRAKLAFEQTLQAADLDWAIVRPTAFFKSLSGQVERVRAGKAFLHFGDGLATACKPISDADLAVFIADTLLAPGRRVLPIGGPGPAITPRGQAALLAQLLGREVRCRGLPLGLMDAAVAGLGLAARLRPALAAKAELARIGRYYASESMLVWDGQAYRDDLTPETGCETLGSHYAQLLAGQRRHALGAHAVF